MWGMIRSYEPKDLEHCLRILREVGWMEGKDTDKEVFEKYVSDTKPLVTELKNEVEVLVLTRTGQVLYQNNDLPMCAVTGVLTSRVARMRGHALKTTALAIANSALCGSTVTFLGIFDQGYYDKLGYGSLSYKRITTIDPASLKVPKLTRAPIRLTKDDAQAIHDCRRNRKRVHGACNLDGAGSTGCELVWVENSFGLGFKNDDGKLTHFIWLKAKGEHGPYHCCAYAWQTSEQLVELLSVLKSLSDQVHGIRMSDPIDFQLQDFIDRPFGSIRSRKGGDFAIETSSNAWNQCRILDVQECLGAMKFQGEPVSFQLELSDPIEQYLPNDCSWRGTSGNWVVTLGENSLAIEGNDKSLPKLSCSINDLSRLWMGAANAYALATVGDLKATPELISKIDSVIKLPAPFDDWDF
jgi:predicted acetyltransferase